MDTTCPDSDYEALLQQYSTQVEALKLSEEKKRQAGDTYKAAEEKKRSLLQALNTMEKRQAQSRATLEKEFSKLMQYNQMNESQLAKLGIVQQERAAIVNGESESMLLNEIRQLSTQYEHLEFEFEDESLQAKVNHLKEAITSSSEERDEYKAVLNSVKGDTLKSESLQEYDFTTSLLPLSESIKQQTSEAFGFSNTYRDPITELEKRERNIKALKEQVITLEKQ